MIDPAKARREGLRWNLLKLLHMAAPYTSNEALMLDTMRGIYPDTSQDEVRKQLDYLFDRKLIDLVKTPAGSWFADIGRFGTDIVEYTVDCDPGIARPPRYGVV
ncbi:MAG: hypothetical protein Q7U97_14480 [Rhodocyclaceae bacterium]|nr:hypothetical protein [Rhodocyclaceae bacterium]